ncbi:MAG: tetratricopeptide repeat protein [Gammaproteobacteria bacterium]|nr:tetratricopeptide repeat protein [Gammaproteobacteria bacterium]MBI5617852.1 tetratricopeptide repeat protein [Gammaproteobacteria bacterium]
MTAIVANLEKMLAAGQDTAVLRFSLGNAYLATDPARAAGHLARAVELDPKYSAAWKLLGKALAAANRGAEARDAYMQGIAVAESKGDIQAAKEMKVFLKRLAPEG